MLASQNRLICKIAMELKSSLIISSHNGHVDVVKVLLENDAQAR